MLSFGFAAKSSLTQACTTVVWEDQASPTSSGSVCHDAYVAARLTSSAGTVTEGAQLEVTSWNNDGVEFTTRNDSYSLRCMVFCVSFPDVSAWAGAPTLPTSAASSFSRTDPQFEPQAIIFAPPITSAVSNVAATRGSICFGIVDEHSQGEVGTVFRDNQVTSDGGVDWSTTRCFSLITVPNTSSWYTYAQFDSFDALGWSGTILSAGPANIPIPYLALSRVYRESIDDDVSITETCVLVPSPVVILTDDVAITTECVIPADATTQVLVLTDAVSITETLVQTVTLVITDAVTISEEYRQRGGGTIVLSDAVTITEGQSQQLLGILSVPVDYVGITETVVLGDVIPTKAAARGTMLAGGAEAGAFYSAGCERGGVL